MGLTINTLELINKNIVIVEDDIYSIKYYDTLLKNTGASVTILRSGLEFIEYIKQEDKNIDFIFMDFLIPLINGIECTKIYRKSNSNAYSLFLGADKNRSIYCRMQ